jgi:hypothetical protein
MAAYLEWLQAVPEQRGPCAHCNGFSGVTRAGVVLWIILTQETDLELLLGDAIGASKQHRIVWT